jgi:hypothetical protein
VALREARAQATAQLHEIRTLQAKNLSILESRLSGAGDAGEVALLRERLVVSERMCCDLCCRWCQHTTGAEAVVVGIRRAGGRGSDALHRADRQGQATARKPQKGQDGPFASPRQPWYPCRAGALHTYVCRAFSSQYIQQMEGERADLLRKLELGAQAGQGVCTPSTRTDMVGWHVY